MLRCLYKTYWLCLLVGLNFLVYRTLFTFQLDSFFLIQVMMICEKVRKRKRIEIENCKILCLPLLRKFFLKKNSNFNLALTSIL